MAVRFGNVLGSSEVLYLPFKIKLTRGCNDNSSRNDRYYVNSSIPIDITMWALERRKIFLLEMETNKIDSLARDLIKLSGFEPDIEFQLYTLV